MADSHKIYAKFVEWYGVFFGRNGLIHLKVDEIMDGVVVVYRFEANVTKLGYGIDVIDVERPNILPI